MTEPNPTLGDATETSLYLYYDANDLLLYVGITKRGITRNHEHNATKEWWPFVAKQTVEHYASRRLALAAEKATIQRLHPPFNKQHNPGYELTREAYLTLRTQGKLPSRASAYNELKWLPLEFVNFDGSRFLYATTSTYSPYVEMLDKDRYGFLCSLKAGKVTVDREHSVLWVTIRGKRGRIGAPRLRVSPFGNGKKRTYKVRGIDLLGDGRAHPAAIEWSARNAAEVSR